VGADLGGVDVDIPVDIACGVGDGLDVPERPLPSPVGRPQQVPFVDRLPGAEALGQLAPLTAGAEPVNDPIDHLPVVPPPAAPVIALGQQRLQHFPFLVGQVAPAEHALGNESADRADSRSWKIECVLAWPILTLK